MIGSGAQLAAAASAARGKHLAAANRSRAGAKAVTAGTNKIAGLEGALHFKTSGILWTADRLCRGPITEAGR